MLSDGSSVENPRHLDGALRRIGRRSRTLARRVGPFNPATGRARVPSNRWRRAQQRVSAAHTRVANLRRNSLHKLTTTIAATYGTVVIEDLHVTGMARNRPLARRIADASFGELRRQLDYKIRWHGGRLIVADRWYPSSKTCSACGAVRANLALSERTFTCTSCGAALDRDDNAAANLRNLAATIDVAGSGPETQNGRGADQKTRTSGQVAVKRQPRTEPTSDKTGTASSQGEAA